MNWYQVALAGLCGGIAAMVGRLLFGKDGENRTAQVAVVLVTFVGLTAISHQWVLPKIKTYRAKAEVTAALQGVPALASLEKYAPQTYQQIARSMIAAIEKGSSPKEAGMAVRVQIQNLIEARLPHASDAAMISYMRVMHAEIGELQSKKNGTCYRFLFPQASAGLDIATHISKDLQNRDMATLDELIKTSNGKRPKPADEQVLPQLQPVMMALHEKYGASMAMIENPTAPGVDKEKVCSITYDMYQKILALPEAQAAVTLRWMLAAK